MISRKPAATKRELNAAFRYYASMAPDDKQVPDLTQPVRAYTKRVRNADDPSEWKIQASVIKWWNVVCSNFGLPAFALHHIPNGGRRDPIEAARLKQSGVRPGIPDLCLPVPRGRYSGCYIEVKDKDGRTSEDQRTVIAWLQSQGYAVSVHRTAQSIMDQLEQYLKGHL